MHSWWSVRAAGIPKSTNFDPPIPELFTLSEALTRVGIALCCIWATYTTTGLSQGRQLPLNLPKRWKLASTPCKVVVPSNIPSPGQGSTVEPPEVVALAAEPPEVSVVSSCELSSCPVTAKKAAYELSSVLSRLRRPPVSSLPVLSRLKKAAYELCPVLSRLGGPPVSSLPVLSRLRRPPVSSHPVLSRPRRPPMNFRPVLSRLRRPSVSSHPVLSRLRRPPMNSRPVLSRLKGRL